MNQLGCQAPVREAVNDIFSRIKENLQVSAFNCFRDIDVVLGRRIPQAVQHFITGEPTVKERLDAAGQDPIEALREILEEHRARRKRRTAKKSESESHKRKKIGSDKNES